MFENLSFVFTFYPVRYQKFEEELELYAKQVDDIQYWGDIDEILNYQKKAQALENKLIHAMQKIDKFNEEEQAFKWETTQYPLRKKIADRLMSFKKLFDAGCEFLMKHEKWVNTQIGSFNPEEIENDASLAYRLDFEKKLKKKFNPFFYLEQIIFNLISN